MNELVKCSKCGRQTNKLNFFSCPKCADKKYPHCDKKRGDYRYGLVDPGSQLECSKCGHKKNFLNPYIKVCEQCSEKKSLPSWRKCYYPLNNHLSHCDLCGEKLVEPECAYCYCQRFGKTYGGGKSHENVPIKPKIVGKETRTFSIELVIKDSDGKIKKLSTKQDWEIFWEKGEGRFSKKETGKPKGGEVQIVEFWQDSKKYELAIGWIYVNKGWFGDRVSCIYQVEPVPEDAFTILVDEPSPFRTLRRRRERPPWAAEKVKGVIISNCQWRKPGKILVGIFVTMVILVCVSFFTYWWRKKNILARNQKK